MSVIQKIRKTNFYLFMQGLTLLLVSIILSMVVIPLSVVFSFIHYFIRFKWQSGLNALGQWMKDIAISIDVFGNVAAGRMFTVLFAKRGGYEFGEHGETISYALGKNMVRGTLTILGRLLVFILELIDSGHMLEAIHSKIEDDHEGLLRLEKGDEGYFENYFENMNND